VIWRLTRAVKLSTIRPGGGKGSYGAADEPLANRSTLASLPNLSAHDFIDESRASVGVNTETAGPAPDLENLRINYRAKHVMTQPLEVAFAKFGLLAPFAVCCRKIVCVNHDLADLAIILGSVPSDANRPSLLSQSGHELRISLFGAPPRIRIVTPIFVRKRSILCPLSGGLLEGQETAVRPE